VPELIGKVLAKTTTDAYASALKLQVPTQMQKVMFHLKENDTNDVKYQVLGSMDDVVYEEVVAEAELLKDGSIKLTAIDEPWPYLDLQVKSSVAETPGKVTAYASGW
jgi:disulfide oxidoreductase YuzD